MLQDDDDDDVVNEDDNEGRWWHWGSRHLKLQVHVSFFFSFSSSVLFYITTLTVTLYTLHDNKRVDDTDDDDNGRGDSSTNSRARYTLVLSPTQTMGRMMKRTTREVRSRGSTQRHVEPLLFVCFSFFLIYVIFKLLTSTLTVIYATTKRLTRTHVCLFYYS